MNIRKCPCEGLDSVANSLPVQLQSGRDVAHISFIGEKGDQLRDVFPAPLRGGVEFSDDFFIVKHHQSLAQLVNVHLVLRQSVAAVQRILALRIVSCGIGLDGSGLGARVHLGGPRQCLRVDILPDVRQFAISNGNGEDPTVLKRPVRGFDSPRSEADDQNPVSLRYEFGGLWVRSFQRVGSLLKQIR